MTMIIFRYIAIIKPNCKWSILDGKVWKSSLCNRLSHSEFLGEKCLQMFSETVRERSFFYEDRVAIINFVI